MTPEIVIKSAVIPGLAAGVALAAAHVAVPRLALKRPAYDGPGPTWLLPALLAGLALVGVWAQFSKLDLWNLNATHRFTPVALAALAAGLIPALPGVRTRAAVVAPITAAAAAAFAAFAFLEPLAPDDPFIPASQRPGWIAALGLIAAAQTFAIGRTAARLHRSVAHAYLAALALGSVLAATAGFANAPALVFPLVATFSAAAAVALLAPGLRPTDAAAAPLVVVCLGVLIYANWYYNDGPNWRMFAVIAAAPLAGLGALLPPLKNRPIVRTAVAVVPPLALLAAQAATAISGLLKATTPEYDYTY